MAKRSKRALVTSLAHVNDEGAAGAAVLKKVKLERPWVVGNLEDAEDSLMWEEEEHPWRECEHPWEGVEGESEGTVASRGRGAPIVIDRSPKWAKTGANKRLVSGAGSGSGRSVANLVSFSPDTLKTLVFPFLFFSVIALI